MAQCSNKIFQNIESTCEHRTVAGIEQTIYLFNRSELTNISYDPENDGSINKVWSFDVESGKTGFKAVGFKKNMTASFERNVSDDTVDTFTDSITLTGYDFSSSSARNFDQMGDLVAIIDRKGTKEQDGSLIILGLENGLFVSADSWASGDNNGARTITLSSLSDAGESMSYYVFNYYVENGGDAREEQTYEEAKAFLESLM